MGIAPAHPVHASSLKRQEEGAGVTEGCKPPLDIGNRTKVLRESPSSGTSLQPLPVSLRVPDSPSLAPFIGQFCILCLPSVPLSVGSSLFVLSLCLSTQGCKLGLTAPLLLTKVPLLLLPHPHHPAVSPPLSSPLPWFLWVPLGIIISLSPRPHSNLFCFSELRARHSNPSRTTHAHSVIPACH